jgi:pilus assembly protein CpaF
MQDQNESYQRFRARLKGRLGDLLGGVPDEQRASRQGRAVLQERLQQAARTLMEEVRSTGLQHGQLDQLVRELVEEVVGFGPLDALLADESISEIMVNGPHQIYIERDGRLQQVDAKFTDLNHLMGTIERMLSTVHLAVNEANPICDASLPDGSRINVIVPPLTLNGPVMTIRRKQRDWTMGDFVAKGAINEEAAKFLEACVAAKINLVVSGGTSTGKTTLVSILASFVPSHDRIITIENVSELDLPPREHWIRLVGKTANMEGKGEISLRVLVKNALRMRPDRIILGEARGGEALDVVQAMHTGHDGVITVLHGNSPQAALERLQTLMLMSGVELPSQACQMQIASAVELMVHMSRYADGSRRIASIAQIGGSGTGGFELEELFTFDVHRYGNDGTLEGALRRTDIRPKCLTKFQKNNVPIPLAAWQ